MCFMNNLVRRPEIAVVQTLQRDLTGIFNMIWYASQQFHIGNPNNVGRFYDPTQVIDKMDEGEPVHIVVSGNLFSSREYSDGIKFARAFKKRNPDGLFFLYTVSPKEGEGVDGIIPKAGISMFSYKHHGPLGRLLASYLPGDMLGGDYSTMRRFHPKVHLLGQDS